MKTEKQIRKNLADLETVERMGLSNPSVEVQIKVLKWVLEGEKPKKTAKPKAKLAQPKKTRKGRKGEDNSFDWIEKGM